ncbi:Amyloid-beta A4 precursor protein-binding family A member 2 [Geodia barretti]|uniref:Amyloid-beta A4 protein-binding family A member 2 n=1 Tax=Geodia barretti TaxID=519541 RepID=A0AA35XC73_GEOBA|nr:Amyloid-beta A4 precursor protein-binding family A member 2 [Geodia barretti]
MTVVSCPTVVDITIVRPDLKFQLGFTIQDGVLHLKTMPHLMYKLITGQVIPLYH